jgi:tape measure domain-containing protein
MATSLKELIVSYQANAQPVIEALNRIDQKIKTTSNQIQSFGTSMRNLGVELGAVFTVPFGMLAKKALSASADFESLKMQMEVLTGSAEKGSALFEKLVKFAAETPFELNQLASATNILMGFGQSSDEAYSNLGLLGDVAAVVNSDFNRLAITFGQASAEGKLFTKDIRELINNNIPVIGLLADELGVAENKVLDFAEQGKITFAVLTRALEKATSKGGMFEGGMAKLAKTSRGVWSTFRDQVNIALATFGDELQKTFNLTEKLKQFGEWIGRLTENFKKLYPETKKNIFLFLGALTILPPILIFLGTMIKIIGFLTRAFSGLLIPIRLLASPITSLIGLLIILYSYWEDFRTVVDFLAKSLFDAFTNKPIRDFIDDLKTIYDWIIRILGTGISKFLKTSKIFLDIFVNKIDKQIASSESSLAPIQNSMIRPENQTISNSTNKNINNSLIVNIPASVSSSDAMNIKDVVKRALQEQNRQSYMEMGVQ